MNTIKQLIFIGGFLCGLSLQAQHVNGVVKTTEGETLVGANVHWMNSNIGTTTNANGQFKLPKSQKHNYIVTSFVGYFSDTLKYNNQSHLEIKLTQETLGTVELAVKEKGLTISNIDPIKTENISQIELNKFACCDLAGGFNTQLTVESKTTNVITNSKELRILGLSGVYNQILFDGFPVMRGLTQTYGISSFPGTLLSNLFVAKGSNSVIQGYESIAGQINVISKKPSDSEKFLLNLYGNNFAEKHLNTHYTFSGKKWKNVLAYSTVLPANKTDRDDDNFLDLPLLKRHMVMNTFQYGKKKNYGWFSTTTLRFLNENRVGGQTNYSTSRDKGSTSVYGQNITYNQPEFWSKTRYKLNDDQTFSLYLSGSFQDQDSYYGSMRYEANQTYLYGKLQLKQYYSDLGSNFTTGISYRYLDIKEDINFFEQIPVRTYDGTYRNKENVFGLFAENSLKFLNGLFTFNSGLRLDFHNEFGTKLTPRALLKYDITEKSSIRANVGYGWRTAQLFSENVKLFAGNRDIRITEELKPEEAINYGVNYTQKFSKNDFSGYISADFYRTEFSNQIFPDYDVDPTLAIVENFEDKSVSMGFQTEISTTYKERFDLKVGYNFSDVYRMQNGSKMELPFNKRHRLSLSTSYRFMEDKLHLDVNVHWNDAFRMPDRSSNPSDYITDEYSKAYFLFNGQIAYYLPKYKFYSGVENILNYRQSKPFVAWQDPFSPYFDTSSAWGPTRGREFYFGVTYSIK